MRLAQALDIARHGRVAPSIPSQLQLSEEAHGGLMPRIPTFQEVCVIRCQDTTAAIDSALTLGQGLHLEVPKHRIFANPQLLSNSPCQPPLLVEGPALLMERPPLHLALIRQLLGCAGGGRGWHRHGDLAVRLCHGRLMKGLIDGLEDVAVGVKHLVEGFAARFCSR